MLNKEYHIFEKNNSYYALDTIRLIPLEISRAAYELLEVISKSAIDSLDSFALEEGYDEVCFLVSKDLLLHKQDRKVINSFRELNLSFIPMYNCNLNCKYCYSKGKKGEYITDTKIVHDAIVFFDKQFSFNICRFDFVSGGEPLLNISMLNEFVIEIQNSIQDRQKKYLLWLCTNGMLLDKDINMFLDLKKFNIGVSLDGTEEINDINRIDLQGNGTYKTVVEHVQEIYADPNLSRNFKNLWNSAVITANTKSLVDIMENSYQIGFRNLQMKMVWSNDETLKVNYEEVKALYMDLTMHLYNLVKNDQLDKFLCICNENDSYGKFLTRLLLQSGVDRRCNAGVNKFSISYQGKIYPCDSFLEDEKYCLGDIYNGFNDKFKSFSNIRCTTLEKCSSCWAKYICGGDCFYHSSLVSGRVDMPDPVVCRINKSIIEMCVSLIIELYRNFPERMKLVYSILEKKVKRMN